MSSQNPTPKEQCIQQALSIKNLGTVIIRQEIVHSLRRQTSQTKVNLGLITYRQSLVETKANIWVVSANMVVTEI